MGICGWHIKWSHLQPPRVTPNGVSRLRHFSKSTISETASFRESYYRKRNLLNGTDDVDWPLTPVEKVTRGRYIAKDVTQPDWLDYIPKIASRGFVSISWVSCYRASACASMHSAIMIWHFSLSVCLWVCPAPVFCRNSKCRQIFPK